MKVYLRTWRYTVEANQGYHGNAVKIDADNMMFHVIKPVIMGSEGRPDIIGEITSVTITAGDELTVIQCDGCEHHPDEPSQEKGIDFVEEPVARRSWMY